MHVLFVECEKSILTALKDNRTDTSASLVTHCNVADKICEWQKGIWNSEVLSANDCKIISITKKVGKDSEIINPDNERVSSQEDSLLQLNINESQKLTSITKEGEAEAIISPDSEDKKRIFGWNLLRGWSRRVSPKWYMLMDWFYNTHKTKYSKPIQNQPLIKNIT